LFASLSDKFAKVFKQLRGHGKVRERHIREAMKQVRRALLEADVNYRVARKLVKRVSERAEGKKVLDSVTPDQQVIKIVHEELVEVLGRETPEFKLSGSPAVVMVCGLQGAGKTSFVSKLAYYLKKKGRNPLLVAADIHRPAAVKQLVVMGEQAGAEVFEQGVDRKAEEIVKNGLKRAREGMYDTVIIDTAGRLHIDEEMMKELVSVRKVASPEETLLVLDSMSGQEAVNVASSFKEEIDFTGLVLSKLDGDAKGGAALSVTEVTGMPVKFVTVGEKPDALERFHPDRMAGRILGMGDVLSLVEKAEQSMDREKAEKLEKKLRKNRFTLEDFLDQLQSLKKMGPLDQLVGMIPGMSGKISASDVDESQMKRVEAIIQSMTPEERNNPDIISGSRRKRIAAGSGNTVQDVNRLLKQFRQMKKMVKQFSKLTPGGKSLGFPMNQF
jgi:signal recognition particle subunit SRP54